MSYFVFKMQLSVPKESEIGFKITELQNEVNWHFVKRSGVKCTLIATDILFTGNFC